MKNDLEVNTDFEMASDEELSSDPAEFTNSDSPISQDRQVAVIPRTPEERQQLHLEILAEEISTLERTINDSVLQIAEKVREARNYFEENDVGESSWSQWVSENLPFGITRANMLLQISRAGSPVEELARQRQVSRERSAKHRRKLAQPSRDGRANKTADNPGEEDSEEGGLSPEARELMEWVLVAQAEDIKKVLSFIRSLPITNDELNKCMQQRNSINPATKAFAESFGSET